MSQKHCKNAVRRVPAYGTAATGLYADEAKAMTARDEGVRDWSIAADATKIGFAIVCLRLCLRCLDAVEERVDLVLSSDMAVPLFSQREV